MSYDYQGHPQFSELRDILIDHYECFKTQRFWLDQFPPDETYVAVCTSVYDDPPFRLHGWIAKFVKRWLSKSNTRVELVFVGPYIWKWEELDAL